MGERWLRSINLMIEIDMGVQGQVKIHVPTIPAVKAGLVAVAAGTAGVAAMWPMGSLQDANVSIVRRRAAAGCCWFRGILTVLNQAFSCKQEAIYRSTDLFQKAVDN